MRRRDARWSAAGALTAVLLALPGCMATFAEYDPGVPALEAPPEAAPSLRLEVESESIRLAATGRRTGLSTSRDYTDAVARAFRACGCLEEVVGSDAGPRELEADVRVRRSVQNRSALLNLLTAYLVPAVESRELSVSVAVRERETGRIARAERSFRFQVWYELLFLPIYPFYSPALFESRLEERMLRASTAEALRELLGPEAPLERAGSG